MAGMESKLRKRLVRIAGALSGWVLFALLLARSLAGRTRRSAKAADAGLDAWKKAENERQRLEESDAHSIVLDSGSGAEASLACERIQAEWSERMRERITEALHAGRSESDTADSTRGDGPGGSSGL